MSVFNRLSDIINSNVNAILEQAEDPEKMVRMITQEMEETLVEVRSASARNIAERKHLVKKIDWLKQETSAWEKKAELAIEKGRDDLAKAALKERNRHEEAASNLEADVEAIDAAIGKLKHDTEQLEEKLRMARTRQKALIMRGKTAKQRIKVKRQIHDTSHEAAFERFEQYERRLDEMEGEIESYDLTTRSLAAEISDLEADEAVDAELAALKARMSGTKPASAEV